MSDTTKYKLCPKCLKRNITFAEKCDGCGADLRGVSVTETPVRARTTGGGGLVSALRVFGVIWGVLGVIATISSVAAMFNFGGFQWAGVLALLATLFLCASLAALLIAVAEVLERFRDL